MPVVETRVAGLEGLVSAILQLSRDLPEGRFLWFRGHRSGAFNLLPGLLRQNRAPEEVFEREKRLLTRFRQRSLPYWPSGYPQNDWEHLFAMQHHGVPTRLLDWSENLFVAAHFALDGMNGEDPTVWCVDPIQWNRSMPVLSEYGESIHVLTTSDSESEPYRPEATRRRNRSPVALFGTHNSDRIVAQRGTFMVWGEDTRSLETIANDGGGHLWRFVLEGNPEQLRSELNMLGFVESMVYPELTTLAAELARVEGWRTQQ